MQLKEKAKEVFATDRWKEAKKIAEELKEVQ